MLVCELIAAGIEGGSKRAIEQEWNLHDVSAMRDHWRKNGPPVSIAMRAIAAALGIDLVAETGDSPAPLADIGMGSSIAELAGLMPVPPGHDTRTASRMIAERWRRMGNG